MSLNSRRGPIVDPGLCRCCGALKKCRILSVEYDWMGQTEIYSEMLVDCFGLVLSQLDGSESDRLICATCVLRLRDARAFKMQVLQCEEKMLTALHVHDVGDSLCKPELKHESDDDSSPHNDDIDDACNTIDQSDEPVAVKLEDSGREAVESHRKRRGPTKVLMKIKRAKSELDNAKYKPKLVYKLKKLAKQDDKDLNSLENAITIVENSYVCPFNAVFSDYFCVYCREMFTDPEKLREHTLTHDPKTYKNTIDNKKQKQIQIDIQRIDCRLCNENIDNLDAFKEHLKRFHAKNLHQIDNEFMKFRLKLGTVSCLECGKSYGFFHALKKHMAQHYGTFICDVCGNHYFEERNLIFHKNTHKIKKDVLFSCNECEKSFRSEKSLQYHVARIHKNEAIFACNKCDDVFTSYHLRYRHKMAVHGEKRTFPCDACDKVFDSRKTLREHNLRAHLQHKRHECTICDKKFYLPSDLRDHMTSHTGERNFRCEYCGKNYPRAKSLKVHMQSHSAEKKYKCALCPSSYTQITNYKNHMKSKHPMPALNEIYA